MKILIINGPNLNLLGIREPDVYGNQGFLEFMEDLTQKYPAVIFGYFQSNIEGEMINALQEAGFSQDGIIRDAIAAISTPVVEVHISNVHAREEFRKLSHVSAKVKGTIAGLGLKGYELALLYLMGLKK
jgi:3-dehydroquinate dehydratase II